MSDGQARRKVRRVPTKRKAIAKQRQAQAREFNRIIWR
jgi:hypothetical protein